MFVSTAKSGYCSLEGTNPLDSVPNAARNITISGLMSPNILNTKK